MGKNKPFETDLARIDRVGSRAMPGCRGVGPMVSEGRRSTRFRVRAGHAAFGRGIEPTAEPAEFGVSVHERTGITFVTIPAGQFQMGSDRGDLDERPVHSVRISQGFLLAKYPVTNAQYARFLEAAAGSAQEPEYWQDRRFNQPEQPVVGVSWDDAQAFCQWAGVRLPTEAQWEYACRAGTTTEYSFGEDPGASGQYAWFEKNSGGQTQPVGAKKPNPWGLYDMHGNVWEWCQDWYSKDYYAQSAEVDPEGPERASGRVFRGGCWSSIAGGCRAAYRDWYGPQDRWDDLGFRVAAVPREQSGQVAGGGQAEPGA